MKVLGTIVIILIVVAIAASALYLTGILKKEVNTAAVIIAPREKVWEALTAFEEYEAWETSLRFDVPPRAVGREFSFHYVDDKGNAGMTYNAELLALDAPEIIRWKGMIVAPILFSGEHEITLKNNGDGSTTLARREVFDGVLVPFYGGIVRDSEKNLDLLNQRLKTYVENQAMPTEPDTVTVTDAPADAAVTAPPS